MKTYLLLLLICISFSSGLYSQKFKKPIDYRFKDGETGYISFFSKSVHFPVTAIEKGTFANSITKISINPEGGIAEITVVNPIDTIIDNEVLRVINLSKNFWKKCDSINHDQVFYIQIAFSLPGFKPNLCKPKSQEIMKLFPEPIIVSIPESLLPTLSKENDSKKPIEKSEDLSERLNSNLNNEKFEDALPFLNELIKRDPFNRDLYKVRIMINVRLNRPELVNQDDNKIFDFAEGFSLDELNKDQY
jgi:hypothetical protein